MLKTTNAALLSLVFGLVSAHHFVCHWTPTGGKPPGGDWQKWCSGQTQEGGNEYKCSNRSGQYTVATYLVDRKTLEIGTPCGRGGYGFVRKGFRTDCQSNSWLACADINNQGTFCYGLDKSDDCEFPLHGPVHGAVDIYFKRNGG